MVSKVIYFYRSPKSQNLIHVYEKKSQNQKIKKFKVIEVGNMYLMGSSLAHRYYPANSACTTIVHHVTGENFNFFDFLGFFHRNGSSSAI